MLSNKVKFALKLFIVLALLVVFAVVGLVLGYNYVIVQSNSIDNLKKSIESGEFEITEDTDGCVPIVIKIGDSTSDIAQTLYDNKLIDNTLIFSLLSKINGFEYVIQIFGHRIFFVFVVNSTICEKNGKNLRILQ